MGVLKKKLKGSTLVEVIVAMVIILTCMGIAMSIFLNVSRDMNEELRILAEIRIHALATETNRAKDYTDTSVDFDNMKLQRNITSYANKAKLKQVTIAAFTLSGKKIGDYKEIVVVETIQDEAGKR